LGGPVVTPDSKGIRWAGGGASLRRVENAKERNSIDAGIAAAKSA
jgi:hypothetical protein